MPIITRELVSVRDLPNGTVKAKEKHTDHLGRNWFVCWVKGRNRAALEAAMSARDLTPLLRDREERDAVRWASQGRSLADFKTNTNIPRGLPYRADLTPAGFDERILREFAQTELRLRPEFMRNVATWIAGFSATGAGSIAERLSIPGSRATKIRNRAIRIRDDIAPAWVLDEADVEERV